MRIETATGRRHKIDRYRRGVTGIRITKRLYARGDRVGQRRI